MKQTEKKKIAQKKKEEYKKKYQEESIKKKKKQLLDQQLQQQLPLAQSPLSPIIDSSSLNNISTSLSDQTLSDLPSPSPPKIITSALKKVSNRLIRKKERLLNLIEEALEQGKIPSTLTEKKVTGAPEPTKLRYQWKIPKTLAYKRKVNQIVKQGEKTDNYAFVLLQDLQGYKSLLSEVIRIFGLTIEVIDS